MKYCVGDIIDERYLVLDVLGKGGHGVVYRAEDTMLGAEVAMKFLHDDIAKEPGFKERMHREARAMGALSGTSAVQVLAFNQATDGGMYLVMELLDGEDLDVHLREIEAQGVHIGLRGVMDLIGPIVETLEAAHKRGIVHRDLKPANIFVLSSRSRGAVRLLDFGLAKDMKAAALTMEGMVAGSPSYIAPESWLGKKDQIDHRIDVYALGVVIYRMLAGSTPFDGKQTIDKLLIQVTRGERPSLHALRPDLPPLIDNWVDKALAIKPDDRFRDVRSLWRVLTSIIGAPGNS